MGCSTTTIWLALTHTSWPMPNVSSPLSYRNSIAHLPLLPNVDPSPPKGPRKSMDGQAAFISWFFDTLGGCQPQVTHVVTCSTYSHLFCLVRIPNMTGEGHRWLSHWVPSSSSGESSSSPGCDTNAARRRSQQASVANQQPRDAIFSIS